MSDFFGLDIGSYSIKIVKASKKKDKFVLDNFAEIRTPVALNSENEADYQTLADAIKKCHSEAKLKAKDCNVSLKESQVYTQVVKFPSLSDVELSKAIRFEAEQFIPVPLEQVNLEYQILKKPLKGSMVEKMEVLIVAAQKKSIDRLLKIMGMTDLKPVSLETEMLATLRVFSVDKKYTDLLISIGHDSSDLALVDKGQLKFVNNLSTAGSAFTRALASQLSMDFNQAEQYKVNYGLDKRALEGKVASILQPIADIFASEVQKSLVFIGKNYPQLKVNRLVLSGGSSELKGLSVYLAGSLGLEIMASNPFYNFDMQDKLPKKLASSMARFTTVVGLALK